MNHLLLTTSEMKGWKTHHILDEGMKDHEQRHPRRHHEVDEPPERVPAKQTPADLLDALGDAVPLGRQLLRVADHDDLQTYNRVRKGQGRV